MKSLQALLIISLFLSSNSYSQRLWSNKQEMKEFVSILAEQQLKAEMKLYRSLPDIIDCKKLSYLEKNQCDNINFIMKRNSPYTTLRSNDGTIVNIPPGTDPVNIQYVLDQSIDNALLSQSKSKIVFEKNELSKQHNIIAKSVLSDIKVNNTPLIDVSSVRISALLDKNLETTTNTLIALKSIKEKIPNINIKIFYRDLDIKTIEGFDNRYGLKGRLMTISEITKMSKKEYPVLLIDNTKHSFRREITGGATISTIISVAEIVSHAHYKETYNKGSLK